jgi:hypothetical protein
MTTRFSFHFLIAAHFDRDFQRLEKSGTGFCNHWNFPFSSYVRTAFLLGGVFGPTIARIGFLW